MKLEERLNEIIEEKDDKIQELENRIEELETQADIERLKWQMHFAFKNEGIFKGLPYPRLEMRLNRLSKDNWYSIEWLYGIVYKHDSQTENDILYFVPLGQTTSSGGDSTFESWVEDDGSLLLPLRDGRHIYTASLTFNIPAYIVCAEKNKYNKIENQGWYMEESLPKMKFNP